MWSAPPATWCEHPVACRNPRRDGCAILPGVSVPSQPSGHPRQDGAAIKVSAVQISPSGHCRSGNAPAAPPPHGHIHTRRKPISNGIFLLCRFSNQRLPIARHAAGRMQLAAPRVIEAVSQALLPGCFPRAAAAPQNAGTPDALPWVCSAPRHMHRAWMPCPVRKPPPGTFQPMRASSLALSINGAECHARSANGTARMRGNAGATRPCAPHPTEPTHPGHRCQLTQNGANPLPISFGGIGSDSFGAEALPCPVIRQVRTVPAPFDPSRTPAYGAPATFSAL